MNPPNTNSAIVKLIRSKSAAILKDLEGVSDQFAITVTMQELKGPVAEYAKKLMDDMLFVLDDVDVDLSTVGNQLDDLKDRSNKLRDKIIKLFNENLAHAIK